MIYPQGLTKGSTIGVTATSAGCSSNADFAALDNAIKQFNQKDYPVIVTDNVRTCRKGRSSDGPTRARELMQLFDNQEVQAIIAAHGGDFLVEMLPYLDFERMKQNPTWVQGYSDITGLTFTLTTNLDMATIYSYNFGTFGMESWHKSLSDCLKLLKGEKVKQESFDLYQDGYVEKITGIEEFILEKKVQWRNLPAASQANQADITLRGRALGGCLDVILNLVGTKYDKTLEFVHKYKHDKIVWFLESFDLSGEDMIRGLWQLKEAGWFEYTAGFMFGRPAMYRTDTDTTYEEAVKSVLGELDVPIILEADIGHKPPQCAMINGALTEIRSSGGKGSINFERR